MNGLDILTFRGASVQRLYHERHPDVLTEFQYRIRRGRGRWRYFDIRDVVGYDGPTGVFQVGQPPKPKPRFDAIQFLKTAIGEERLA